MNTKTQSALISDDQSLVGASRNGYTIPVYDDGCGELYIHRDSMGISGIVRAQSLEDAYGICEDEFFPACDLTHEEIVKEYGFRIKHAKIIKDASGIERDAMPTDYPFSETGCSFVRWETRETKDQDAWGDNELFQEAYGFRSNGRKESDGSISYIYAKDINGDSLEVLTPSLLAELGITLKIETNE